MNSSELAEQINGIEYDCFFTDNMKEFAKKAKASGLVIVCGASDDLMEFYGAFRDECDCYDGGTAHVDAEGLLPERDNIEDDDDLKRFFARQPNAKAIEALWCAEDGYSWTYKTDIPHATFEVMEGGEHYCRGIVFALKDVAVAA